MDLERYGIQARQSIRSPSPALLSESAAHRGVLPVYGLPWRTAEIRPHLQRWQDTYNHIRPHQSLGGRTSPSS